MMQLDWLNSMHIFNKEYIYALSFATIVLLVLFSMGFVVRNKYKYAKFLGIVLIIFKALDISYIIFKKWSIFTNFSLVSTVVLISCIIFLITNNRMCFNLSYHFMYVILLILLFIPIKCDNLLHLFLITTNYFLIILAILYGSYFLRQKVIFAGLVCSIISLFILISFAYVGNKGLGTNMFFIQNSIVPYFNTLSQHIYLAILMILNLLGICFLYVIKKN